MVQGKKIEQIEDTGRKCIIFSKRKRGFLKKAIELSQLCGWNIFICMKEQSKDRVIQFQTSQEFDVQAVYNAIRSGRKDANAHMYERFTNEDYDDLNGKDFRTIRHRKREIYRDASDEVVEELELKRVVKKNVSEGASSLSSLDNTAESKAHLSLEQLPK